MSIGLNFLNMAGNYEDRKIGRVMPGENNGVGVSTCYVNDMDEYQYETALLDAQGAIPVERYFTKEEAVLGHKKWIEKAKKVEEAIKLGSNDGIIKDVKMKIIKVIVN